VQRALAVGALNCIIPPANLRPYLIDAVERGIAKEEKLELTKPETGISEIGTAETEITEAA
jgi:hypothetical protein